MMLADDTLPVIVQFTISPPAHVASPQQPTALELATTAALTVLDTAQTVRWLAPRHAWHFETDPVLGRHPSALRVGATLFTATILREKIKSAWLRRALILLQFTNVKRNFGIGMTL